MDKLEIKQGSFIQQTQYFIPVEINDFYRICPSYRHVWESLIFSNFHLSDVSFHWYRTNVNVEACQCCISNLLNKKTTGHVWQSHYIQNNNKNVWRTIGPPSTRLLSDLTKICPLRSDGPTNFKNSALLGSIFRHI